MIDTGLDEDDEDLIETDQVDFLQDDNSLVLALVMTGAAMLLTGQGSGLWYNRRRVDRVAGGPMNSTIMGYLLGDEITMLKEFRMTREELEDASKALAAANFLPDSNNRNMEYRFPGRFKFAVCMYAVAHGGCGTSQFKPAADGSGLGESTVRRWMNQFCLGLCSVLAKDYLRTGPPTKDQVQAIRRQFASRRGVPNVALAVDGKLYFSVLFVCKL